MTGVGIERVGKDEAGGREERGRMEAGEWKVDMREENKSKDVKECDW